MNVKDFYRKLPKNMMTPDVLKVDFVDSFAVELSTGRFPDLETGEYKPRYGVSVIKFTPEGKRSFNRADFVNEPSVLFNDKLKAKEYYAGVKTCIKNDRIQSGCLNDLKQRMKL